MSRAYIDSNMKIAVYDSCLLALPTSYVLGTLLLGPRVGSRQV